tara:strand:- start:569 stop:1093 length:525 start_codon:yes stop_codon:yes gene_type:complete
MIRAETRLQRYNKKLINAKVYPVSICAINFTFDENIGYIIRAAACFGAEKIHLIGRIPSRSAVKATSGSLYDFVSIESHSSPRAFLQRMREEKVQLISAELTDQSNSIENYKFSFEKRLCIVVGNESYGIPEEILHNSEKVYIPMPGIGFCLNTAQAANIMLYETVKQYERLSK